MKTRSLMLGFLCALMTAVVPVNVAGSESEEGQPRRAPQQRRGAASAPAPAARPLQVFVLGAYSASALNFSELRTYTLNVEQGSLTTAYTGGKGAFFELGASYRFRPRLAVSGSFQLFGADNRTSLNGSLPHPFFYNRPRQLSGTAGALQYEEKAIHVDLRFALWKRKQLAVDVFGGPTFFITSTEAVANVTYSDTYPYDSVSFSAATTAKLSDNPIGFNVGADGTYRLTDRIGMLFFGRFSRGSVSVTPDGGAAINFNAGGFHAGGGIRISL